VYYNKSELTVPLLLTLVRYKYTTTVYIFYKSVHSRRTSKIATDTSIAGFGVLFTG